MPPTRHRLVSGFLSECPDDIARLVHFEEPEPFLPAPACPTSTSSNSLGGS